MQTPFSLMPLVANGNVRPNRFLTLVAGTFGAAVEATAATQILVGVSADGGRYAPGSPGDDGFIAIAGEGLDYVGPLQTANLKLGGTVSDATILLTTDANGCGVASAPSAGTTKYYGALALRAGAADDVIPVWVLPPIVTN